MASTRYCDAQTTRSLIGMYSDATRGADHAEVIAAAGTLRMGLVGDAGAALTRIIQRDPRRTDTLTAFDAELYGAAESLGMALLHVARGEDATAALDAAQGHLHAALDARQAVTR